MDRDIKAKKKTYKSMKDFEKEFYPNSYEISLSEELKQKTNASETRLALEIIERVRKKLSK
jgi:hypothetical protein